MTASEQGDQAPTTTSDPGDHDWLTVRTGGEGYRTEVSTRGYTFVADEPADVGGSGAGPTPYDYLLGALGACTAMTVRWYAARKGWPLESVVVKLRNARSHAQDCADCEKKPVGFRRLERRVELHGPLDAEQRQRLLAIADRCPVKQTLGSGIEIVTTA